MKSVGLKSDLLQTGKQLDPKAVFNGLKDTFGDTALCVEDEEWSARIEHLRQTGRFTANRINWHIEGWGQRIHLVNQAGRLATVGMDSGRYVITTASHWARTNRDKSLLTQRRSSNHGESYIIQELDIPDNWLPVRATATATVTQPELGLLTASRVIGNRVLTAEAGRSLLERELWALDQEVLGYRDAGYKGAQHYRDESMPGLITAELLSSFTES